MSDTIVISPPPLNDKPQHSTGDFNQSWVRYFQDMTDKMNAFMAGARKGVQDGSDAIAGYVGEYMEATGSASLSTGTVTTVASLDLTAGDWDVSGNASFSAGSGTHTAFGVGIGGIDVLLVATYPSAAGSELLATATHRYNVTANTTVSLMAQATFTGIVSANGTIRARRIR